MAYTGIISLEFRRKSLLSLGWNFKLYIKNYEKIGFDVLQKSKQPKTKVLPKFRH